MLLVAGFVDEDQPGGQGLTVCPWGPWLYKTGHVEKTRSFSRVMWRPTDLYPIG